MTNPSTATACQVDPMRQEEGLLIAELLEERMGMNWMTPEQQHELEVRLAARMEVLRLSAWMDYYHLLLARYEQEFPYLAHLLTNRRTWFFREHKALLTLLTTLIDESPDALPVLHILCVGCSTGEEPFSLSTLAKESRLAKRYDDLRIDAFDLDPVAVNKAHRAVYGPFAVRKVDSRRFENMFQRIEPERFLLRAPYRQGVRIRQGNLMDPSSFDRQDVRYDAILCRSVLDTFTEDAARRALNNMYNMLKPRGYLMLGAGESLQDRSDMFEAMRLQECIVYQAKEVD